MKTVILCGGAGTRLWPLSRDLYPKQFNNILQGESLFYKTIQRNSSHSEDFLVLINQEQYFLAMDQLQNDPLANKVKYLIEPTARNTAGAITMAALSSNPEDVLLVVPSDHLIENQQHYLEKVQEAKALAQEGYLVTFGIQPTRAETGYGHIKFKGHDVIEFVEKPDLEKAKHYTQQGDYLWNSGMFCFCAKTLIEQMQHYAPEVFKYSQEALQSSSDFPLRRIPMQAMSQIPSISIDYALMEKSKKIKIVPTQLQWSDIGSFDALSQTGDKDEQGNSKAENVLTLDAKDNYIIAPDNKLVGLIGVEGVCVIDGPDALMLVQKGHGQKVKALREQVKKLKPELTKVHPTAFRPWGSYTVLEDAQAYKVKRIEVKKGQKLSLQKHHHRSEHWIVVAGRAKVSVDDKVEYYQANQYVYIPLQAVHRLENEDSEVVILIEVQVGDYLGEDDIVRLQDDYNRG